MHISNVIADLLFFWGGASLFRVPPLLCGFKGTFRETPSSFGGLALKIDTVDLGACHHLNHPVLEVWGGGDWGVFSLLFLISWSP